MALSVLTVQSDVETSYVVNGSLVVTFNTLDVDLYDPIVTNIESGSTVALTNPTWSGTITGFSVRTLGLKAGAKVVWHITATNTTTPSGSAAAFGLSDVPDNSTTYGYVDLQMTNVINSDGTEGILGSLRCWQPGLWPAMTFALTSAATASFTASPTTFTIEQVTVTYDLNGQPIFDVAFHDSGLAGNRTMAVWVGAPASAFPTAPNLYDRVFRQDLGREFYYDGSVWRSMGVSTTIINVNADSAADGLTAINLNGRVNLTTGVGVQTISGNTDNWSPTNLSTSSYLRVTLSSPFNLTGIVAGVTGDLLLLTNEGTSTLTLKHDATSTATNRFYCPGAVDFALTAKKSCWIVRDGNVGRWMVVG